MLIRRDGVSVTVNLINPVIMYDCRLLYIIISKFGKCVDTRAACPNASVFASGETFTNDSRAARDAILIPRGFEWEIKRMGTRAKKRRSLYIIIASPCLSQPAVTSLSLFLVTDPHPLKPLAPLRLFRQPSPIFGAAECEKGRGT